MLKQRVITALVLVLVLAAVLWLGPTAFVAAAAILMGAAYFEWFRLAGLGDGRALWLAVALGAGLLASDLSGVRPGAYALTWVFAIACAIWLGLALLLVQAERRGVRLGQAAIVLLGVLLVAAAWLALLALYQAGVVVLMSVLAIVWLADIAAYFVGRALGKRKLAPHISPGKTWAGVFGALVCVVLAAEALALWQPALGLFSTRLAQALPLKLTIVVLLALVALAIVGDLFESLLKRQAGVKDSSGLLPGHGGVLDRIDALLPVLPAAALLQLWVR